MMLGRDRFPATRCSGEQILLLQSFSGELNLTTAKRISPCSISSLHEEGVRFHSPLHDAPGSKAYCCIMQRGDNLVAGSQVKRFWKAP
jgi:hypothetical protein